MKKFLSILFCAVLLTTCFTKGFSLSAANTSAVSQQSAIPDHVNLKGENAIKDFYTKDGETLIPAIAAIYPMDCPSAECRLYPSVSLSQRHQLQRKCFRPGFPDRGFTDHRANLSDSE